MRAMPELRPIIDIALLEDDPACAERFARAIGQDPQMRLVAQFDRVEAAIFWLASHQPDILLCDLGLPDHSGLEVIRFCSNQKLSTKVLVITLYEDEPHVLNSIEAGASGYLLKDSLNEQIAENIWQVIDGGSPLTPIVARYLLKKFQPQTVTTSAPASEKMLGLSEREMQVLIRVSQGFSYIEIAALLELSRNTVHTYIKRIYEKLAVHSRTEAVFEARQLGLIS